MKKLVVIDACVREKDSRTLRIAEPIVEALGSRYETVRYRLPQMPMGPLTPRLYAEREAGSVPEWAIEAAREVAGADRILIAAPFWDMSFPAVLKVFFEHISLFGITFDSNDKTCRGLCRSEKVLFVTTRGMDISTGDPREQATPYLKALSSLWNMGEIITVAAQNMDYSTPEDIERKIAACRTLGLQIAETF